MNQYIKQFPGFFIFLTATLVILAGQLVFVLMLMGDSAKLVKKIKRDQRILHAYQSQALSPSQENLAILESLLMRLEQQNQEKGMELFDVDAITGLMSNPFQQGQDLFFDLVAMREDYFRLAEDQNIDLIEGRDEGFGFSRYFASGKGPEGELMETVYRHRVVVGELLDGLFAARPQSLVSVRYSGMSSVAQSGADPGGSQPFIGTGMLDNISHLPAFTVTGQYEVVFRGRTQALRLWMEDIHQSRLPLFVRLIEVQPVESSVSARTSGNTRRSLREKKPVVDSPFSVFDQVEDPEDTGSSPADPKAPELVPIISRNVSEFTVTVDCVLWNPHAPKNPAPESTEYAFINN